MSAKKSFPYWPVAGVVALVAALVFSNQSAPLPTGLVPLRGSDEYNKALDRIHAVSDAAVKRYEAGETLSPEELAKVREASVLSDRIVNYSPLMASLYFLSGKLHQILGENEVAEERYRQCTLGIEKQAENSPEDRRQETLQTGAEAAYQLSELLLRKRNYTDALEQADFAVKLVPQSSQYHTARASALNELRRLDEAKKEIDLALQLDPANRRAAGLQRILTNP